MALADQTIAAFWGRKVRTTQGSVPANGWGAKAYDKCNRE